MKKITLLALLFTASCATQEVSRHKTEEVEISRYEPAASDIDPVSLDQNVSAALQTLGMMIHQTGLDQAIVEYESQIVMDPDDTLMHFCLGNAYVQKYKQINSLQQWDDNQQDVAGVYRKYLGPFAVDPVKDSTPLDGKEYLDKATRAWQKSIELKPDFLYAHLVLGDLAFHVSQNFDEAVTHFKTAYDLTHNPSICHQLIVAYRKQGAFAKARALCEELLMSSETDNPEIYCQLALTFMDMGSMEDAVIYGEKAVEIMPGSVDSYISLAKIYREAGQFKKSIEVCDRVLVEPLKEAEVKKGGIIIPDTAKEKPQEGRVIALGNR